MRVMPAWAGAVIGVGDEIEIHVFLDQHGDVKLGVSAPPNLRIARRKGSQPRLKRRQAWERRDVAPKEAAR